MSMMRDAETSEIHELTDTHLDQVNGGEVSEGPRLGVLFSLFLPIAVALARALVQEEAQVPDITQVL